MMIDRRDFLVGMALGAVASVLGVLRTQATPIAAAQAIDIAAHDIAFMIDGWSMQDDSATGDQVWIWIDRSWRTAWR
jgi:hypothetical protein